MKTTHSLRCDRQLLGGDATYEREPEAHFEQKDCFTLFFFATSNKEKKCDHLDMFILFIFIRKLKVIVHLLGVSLKIWGQHTYYTTQIIVPCNLSGR